MSLPQDEVAVMVAGFGSNISGKDRFAGCIHLVITLALIFFLCSLIFWPLTVQAACSTTLSITLLNDPHLLVDSNNPASGPQVTTAYAKITNTGASTAYNVYAYIGNGITPGTFAAGSDGQRLSMLGSVSDATRFIVNLAPGESRTVYWMLKYPLTNGKTYPMTIWASNADGCFVQGSHTYTTQSTISASADKILGSVSFDPADGQVRVGNILTITATGFNFGIIGQGGDAWVQPVGNIDFNPDHFRLVKTEVNIHSLANQCGYGPMPVYDRLYFPGIRTCYSFNPDDYVKYYFVAISEGTTTAKIYQEAASGAQEKYSIDYGKPGTTVTFTAHCGGLLLGKSVAPQTAVANTLLTWTITYRNESDLPIGDPGTGNGLTVREDALPVNTAYVAGSATCSGTCIIYYSTDNGVTWTTTEPAPSQVTRIKWFINQAIPAHTSGTVSFQTRVNSDVIGAPLICNTASAGIADCPFDPVDIVCANGGADLDLLKVVDDKSPCEGGNVTYVVTVNNPSTTDATGVQVTDILPSGLTYLGYSATQGTYNNVSGLWLVGNLNAAASAALTLRARVNIGTAGTTIINWGNITYADQPDPVLLNNADHDGITVHAAPAAYPSANSPVCEGATLYLFGSPGSMTSYHWTGPSGFISDEQNPVRPNANLTMAGDYSLTVTDISGCGNATAITTIVVNAAPIASPSSNSPVCEGDTIELYGDAGMDSYSWTGPNSFNSTLQNPTIPNATLAMAGTYNLTVTDEGCTSNPVGTIVTVNVCSGESPNQPPNISPNDGDYCVNIPATLQSGPFSDPDMGDTHAASQWQVRTNLGSYASPIFDSGTDTGNLTSIVLDLPTLDYETWYYWRVRYQDNTGRWSSYSDETSFRTCDTPPGTSVTVIRDDVPITFDQVNVAGCTIVTKQNDNPIGFPLPSGFCPLLPFVHVATTADYIPPGNVVVGIPYSGSGISDENALRVFHETGSGWEDVTLYIDTDNNIAYGQDDVLSWWCIGGPCPQGQSVPAFPTWYIGIAVALGAGVLAYVLRRRIIGRKATEI